MAAFTVTTAADLVDAGDGVLSLREAVRQANATGAADSIRFAQALEGRTLTLTQGQLDLTSDLTIDGDRDNDDREVAVSGGGESRVLAVTGGDTDARLVDLGITGGVTTADSPLSAAYGAGIRLGAGAALSLDGCSVTGNSVGFSNYAYGGGIFADDGASISVSRSTIAGNSAREGGGLFLSNGCSAVIEGSRVTANGPAYAAYTAGGGISAAGSRLAITASSIDGNTANYGGGIRAVGTELTVERSTIAGNTALLGRYSNGASGGGLSLFGGVALLADSTITGNRIGAGSQSPDTGGISSFDNGLTLANAIVAGSSIGAGSFRTASDIGGTVTLSNGHNIVGSGFDGNVAGDREGVVASLLFARIDPATGGGALALNGGPTPTVALRDALDNPALSGGEPVVAGDADQRGVARPSPADTNPDVGAFELDQSAVSRAPTAGNDVLAGTAGADTLNGLGGADLLLGRGGNDRLNGDAGGDVLRGGLGDDRLDGGAGEDTASYRDATGAVTVSLAAGAGTGAAGRDTLVNVENLEGGAGSDGLTGDALRNWLGGRGDDDRLFGLAGGDRLFGDAGDDRLNGGLNRDRLVGGAGDDVFDYDRLGESPAAINRSAADQIADFAPGADAIDLSAIDARPGTSGNQAFVFLAREGAAFTGTGQVRWFQAADGDTVVEANADADARPELQIELAGLVALNAADCVL